MIHYIEINGLDSRVARDVLGDIPKEDFRLALQGFYEWFNRRKSIFYRDQITQIQEKLMRQFCRENAIDDPIYVYEDEYLSEMYADFKDSAEGYKEALRKHEDIQSFDSFGSYRPKFEPIDLNDYLDGTASYSSVYIHNSKLIRAWWDNNIQNTPEKQKELKAMPYQDYLKSYHWQKVRAYAVFTFDATCLGKPCDWNMGESMWMLYAVHRQVHHLSYKNRGNERFGDVCILCDECHEALHKKNADVVDNEVITQWLKLQSVL